MVLFPIRVADQRDTLSRWHAEVYEHELKHEGTVHRGGRWLQRRDKGREHSWLQDNPHERGSTLRGDARRYQAAMHRLETLIEDPSDRAIFHRASQDERLLRLLYERLLSSMEPEVAATMMSLEERRRAALLRPGLEAIRDAIAEEEKAAATPSRPASQGGGSQPVAPAVMGSAAASGGGGGLMPAELQRASWQWEEACQALSEEWQLLIEARLRQERAALVNSEAGRAHDAIAGAPADGSPHRSAEGARTAQRLLEKDTSTLTHLLARLSSDDVRASCAWVHDSLGEWTRELAALAGWTSTEL